MDAVTLEHVLWIVGAVAGGIALAIRVTASFSYWRGRTDAKLEDLEHDDRP